MKPIRFRYNIAIALAGLLGFLGAIPVATSLIGYDLDGTVRSGGTPGWAYLLLLILLVPLAVALWGWRAGTDADAAGLRLRALFGSRSVRWDEITAIVPQGRRVLATLTNGRAVALPAVTRADIPRLVAATGQPLAGAADPDTGEPDAGNGDRHAAVADVDGTGVGIAQ